MAEGKGISVGLSLVITICMVLVTGLSTYFSVTYSMQNEINLVKKDQENDHAEIVYLKEELEKVKDLPGKMETLQKTTDETNTLVRIIRDAMLAAGIIKPSTG